jgi:hypothetical protein
MRLPQEDHHSGHINESYVRPRELLDEFATTTIVGSTPHAHRLTGGHQ